MAREVELSRATENESGVRKAHLAVAPDTLKQETLSDLCLGDFRWERCIPNIAEIESVAAPLFLGHTSDMVLGFRIFEPATNGVAAWSDLCSMQYSLVSLFP